MLHVSAVQSSSGMSLWKCTNESKIIVVVVKLKLCLNRYYTLIMIFVGGRLPLGLFYFIYFCEDMPDDGHLPKTCSVIMRRWVFTIITQLCMTVSICWIFNSDNTTRWLYPRKKASLLVYSCMHTHVQWWVWQQQQQWWCETSRWLLPHSLNIYLSLMFHTT
jgi:hypothetical protein